MAHRYNRSLEASWKEGIAAVIMITITDYYVIPMGLMLGASSLQIGLLVAVPHLLSSFAQLLAVTMTKLIGSRLRFLVYSTLCQAVMLVGIALLAFFTRPSGIWLFIFAIALFRIVGSLIATVWGSLVSDYLLPDERGNYFGWRSRITSIAGLISLICGGIVLYLMRQTSIHTGFFLLFLFTACARFISAYLMAQMEDIPLAHTEDSDFTFMQFIRRFNESNFVKFVAYVTSITFATQIASPYFSVYMLKILSFNYLQYMAIHLTSLFALILSMPVWGRHADLIGNAKVLKTTSICIPFIPILWILTRYFPFLIGIELLAGFVWAGFNLCSVNYIFDAVTPEKRIRCLSYFALINGIAIFLGANTGAFLLKYITPLLGSRFYTVFLISGLARLAAHILFCRHFHEVRTSTQKISSKDLFFSVLGIRPIIGRNKEVGMFTVR
ncbi:MAG: MFS transporter [Candidatus Omnitrophica bacterium]|nr:MFS transporter [Candidatus Omnitrophota bacterium]